MIKIKETDDNRLYKLIQEVDGEEELISDINLVQHSLSNNFDIIDKIIEYMCENTDEFEDWYSTMIKDYIESEYNAEIISENMSTLVDYAKKYVDIMNIDFSKFVNLKKRSKTSVIFFEEDHKEIAISSAAMKLYAPIMCSKEMKLPDNTHKKVWEEIMQGCIDKEVTTKIFQLIRSRTYTSSMTDRYMWDFIKLRISETPESYIVLTFNFIMNNIVGLLDVDKNPVPYIVSVVDDSIGWMMRTVFKDQAIYGEIFGGAEDVYGSSLTRENFHMFCCNDVVSKAAKIGMDLIEDNDDISDEQFEKIRDRLEDVNQVSPISKLITFPIASKIFEVPYKFLLTIPPKHSVLLGMFLHEIADELEEEYPIVTEFLPTIYTADSVMTKSTYRIRNLEFVINDDRPIFGFNSKYIKFIVLSNICGALAASRRNLIGLIDGKKLGNMTYLSLEHDITKFYINYFHEELNSMFSKMAEKADKYF